MPLHVVVDLGAILTRVGIAGEDMPRVVLPSFIVTAPSDLSQSPLDPDTVFRRGPWRGRPLDACRPLAFSNVKELRYPLRSVDELGVAQDLEGVRLLLDEALQQVRPSAGLSLA